MNEFTGVQSGEAPSFPVLDTGLPAVSFSAMNLVTVEVELNHGRVRPKGGETLPETASALLTILPAGQTPRDPLSQDPELRRVKFHEDAASPLSAQDWPEAFS